MLFFAASVTLPRFSRHSIATPLRRRCRFPDYAAAMPPAAAARFLLHYGYLHAAFADLLPPAAFATPPDISILRCCFLMLIFFAFR